MTAPLPPILQALLGLLELAIKDDSLPPQHRNLLGSTRSCLLQLASAQSLAPVCLDINSLDHIRASLVVCAQDSSLSPSLQQDYAYLAQAISHLRQVGFPPVTITLTASYDMDRTNVTGHRTT